MSESVNEFYEFHSLTTMHGGGIKSITLS